MYRAKADILFSTSFFSLLQSWSPHNLYNLLNRSMPMFASNASFRKTSMTMYQQRWRSKKLLRGYHGDWIREKQFKRWYLPVDLPNLSSKSNQGSTTEASSAERMPIASLFVRDVERRLDTVIFRCCFARSAREARALVVQGKVHVNGTQVSCIEINVTFDTRFDQEFSYSGQDIGDSAKTW